MKILNALKNINGEFEVGRLLLASGGALTLLTPIGFQIAYGLHNNWHFDVTAWCVAYPGGFAALNAIGVFAIGKKDKDVAAARATNATTAQQIQDTAAAAPGTEAGKAADKVAGAAVDEAANIKGKV